MRNEIIPYASTIIAMIEQARNNALKTVNAELIQLYWNIGEYLSAESAKSAWGDSFIDDTAKYIKENCPEIKGFSRRNLYRMRQFYETYKDNEFVPSVMAQISWTHHSIILYGTKSLEAKEFYVQLCIKEGYTVRELERQINSAYYERYMLSSQSLAPTYLPENVKGEFFDRYVLEFLDLPNKFSEKNLRKSIIHNLKDFILEIGKDFTFIGEEYRVQVGGYDYFIDLLFFHRGLACLVAFELKTDRFEPEFWANLIFILKHLIAIIKNQMKIRVLELFFAPLKMMMWLNTL